MKFFSILIFAFSMQACTKHDGHEKATLSTVNVNEVAQDIQLPKNLLQEFEKELAEEFKNLGPVFVYTPLQVRFDAKEHQSVLKDTPLRFQFEKGGGQIDLKDVVSGGGSFFMSFPAEQFSSAAEIMHLYYVSQSPVKRIDAEPFGLGCGKWVDMKGSFKKLQDPEFLKLNTTQQRYIHVLAGHYVFIFKQTNQIFLTQLTITDSRFKNDLCTSLTGETK